MTDFAASTGTIRVVPPARVRGALPWIVWVLGTLTYLVAIVGRSSLAGLGTDVAVRFDAGSATLALFATLQLAVYGALQVPAGLLLDRFGARIVVTAGMLTMAGGSVWLAFAGDAPTAIAARVLTGAGDAMIFPSVLRLLALWFPARRVPLIQQVTAQTGQLGQVLSVVVLTALVHAASWEIAFVALAATFVVFALLDVALIREREPRRVPGRTRPRQGALLVAAVREPGTRLAFWMHFVTPFAGTAFALLWGIPFLTAGEGLDADAASLVVVVFVLSGAVFAPVMGLVSGARPARRPAIAIVSVLAQAAAFGGILLTPGPAPMWLLVVWVVTLSSGGAASMVAFDVARRDNPVARLSTATGVVNMGGFIAALVAVYLIGLALDLQHADPAAYTRGELRGAMATVYALWAVGLVGIGVESWRRRRAHP
ncbi:nitrate/nitrite transporter [Microbacterium sp. 18062]|uniref:MFS transporter n=1 Tax=Microbacterium sp. 18062 TaxID=2681410 RepID=UPI001357AE49|nr:MFS transporter [Microbacterium sp. 18062]